MKPAAVLVAAFQIQISRKSRMLGVRAAQHGLVRGARVEPHVQRVAVFLVLIGLITEQLTRIERLPGLDALALDALRHLLEQLMRARVQRPGFLVHEEGHRNAPLPLA